MAGTRASHQTEEHEATARDSRQRFTRIVAIIVALENYRRPSNGDALPSVAFAHADADAMCETVREIFKDMPSGDVIVETIKDADASLIAVRDQLSYTIRNLSEDDLFIFYYAGHGFHGSGGNRLSTYDTNRSNVGGTSLQMREDLLEPLAESECRQALVFVDACAEQFREVVESRDVIANLEVEEVEEFLDSGWYLGVFLSCSPGEKSYPAAKLGHGIWTHFLLEALSGQAERALTRDRWLTDGGLRDYLRQEVPRFITRETSIRGTQTPQAIVSGTNTFRIHHAPRAPAVPADAALAGIRLRNQSEYLEGIETGAIRQLDGFQRGFHTVPTQLSDSADNWCHRMLTARIAEELQELYQNARAALGVRRRDLRKEEEEGAGDLDTPAFRYIIESGQNPEDPAEYYIRRRLELRQGWASHRDAIDELFRNEFQLLVVEFESMDDTFDDLVDRLEDICDEQGGGVEDDDRHKRVSYRRDGVTFTFDLRKKRLEISFGQSGALQLVDAAQKFQLGIGRSSPMLAAPAPTDASPARLKRGRG
ncbi:caspase family protein [Rhizobium johnstonii]